MFKKTLIASALVFAAASSANALTYTFQEGVAGYVGTQDTQLKSNETASPGNQTGASFGNDASISVDGDDGSPGAKPNHGLIRFDNIFGSLANQIKPTDTITSATLTLQAFDPGSGLTGYDMTTAWSESSTWNSLVGGVNVGTDTTSTAQFTVGANNSNGNVAVGASPTNVVALTFSVLASLQAWQLAPSTNLGWALLPFVAGTNGIDFYTSEFATANLRPLLTVEVTPIPEPGQIAMIMAGLGLVGAIARRRKAV